MFQAGCLGGNNVIACRFGRRKRAYICVCGARARRRSRRRFAEVPFGKPQIAAELFRSPREKAPQITEFFVLGQNEKFVNLFPYTEFGEYRIDNLLRSRCSRYLAESIPSLLYVYRDAIGRERAYGIGSASERTRSA